MKHLKWTLALAASLVSGVASAEISDNAVRVGVLNDISGIFQDTNGMGSAAAARMGAEDRKGRPTNTKHKKRAAERQKTAGGGSARARQRVAVHARQRTDDVPKSA